MIHIADPWFEWLYERDLPAVRVWLRNVTNFPSTNITWQGGVHRCSGCAYKVTFCSSEAEVTRSPHSTAEKVIRQNCTYQKLRSFPLTH